MVPNFAGGPSGAWGTGIWSAWSSSFSAVYTFEPDGTGTSSETFSVITLNNSSEKIPWSSAGVQKIETSFTYSVALDGTITITEAPNKSKTAIIHLRGVRRHHAKPPSFVAPFWHDALRHRISLLCTECFMPLYNHLTQCSTYRPSRGKPKDSPCSCS